ncbi:MAG TPA: ABC transporter [Dehalococcoidia bacterium]|nr:ABC transporter [Dehalococcoidia bacterium]
MLKLIKHLRPYAWFIAAIFVLLFAQAMSDLSLPGLMSNIVNVGIQQNGIESSVPQAIRASELSKLTLFMSEEDKAGVTADYILLSRDTLSSIDYAHASEEYPLIAAEPLYKLNATGSAELDKLDAILGRYIPIIYAIEKGGATAFAGMSLQIPAGTDPFAIIAQLPSSQVAGIRSVIETQMKSLPHNLTKQYSFTYISSEYKTIGMDISGIQTMYMLRIGLLMFLLTLFSAACSITVGFLSARVAAALGRDLRRKLFVRVESFSATEFDTFSTASLITRSTNDITQIQMLIVMLFRVVFYAPIVGIGGIIKVAGADPSMLWIIAAAVVVMLTMVTTVFSITVPKFILIQKLVDKLNMVTREILSGLMVIRAFNTQRYEEEKFDRANDDLRKTGLFVNKVMVFMMPSMMLIMNSVMLLILWIGSHQVDAGTTLVGDMMAFMQYATQIIFSFFMVSFMFIMMPRATVSANRINEVLETEPAIKDPEKPVKFADDLKGVVEFQNVSFRYSGADDDLLKHISFTAKPGQTTALIGSTGSGKSTLINLILRFHDVTGGKVLVGGVDVREVTQHSLREKIGYVPQNAVLFSGTIKSNIQYADENATELEISKYAETAQALDFITTSDEGYDTFVSQGGNNLSGGQKQRLSIARALARKPDIYIFDDSFSALDFKTDAALRKALKKETGNATVLIVTQRISAIMGAEQIVVLDNGEVCGIGTHNELLKNCAVYREIALSQLSQEELVS